MPVISAAISAIIVAATVTTIGTVASAVAAVSVAVGTLGMAVTAVGMITKNKTLMGVGKIMGYVGLAGGLAGGAIGGLGAMANGTGTFLEGASQAYQGASNELSHAFDKGIGSWFSNGAAEAVTGAVPMAPGSAVTGSPGYTVPSVNQAVDSSIANAGSAVAQAPKSGVLSTPSIAEAASAAPSPVTPVSPSAPSAPSAPVGATGPAGAQATSFTQVPGSGVMADGSGLINTAKTGLTAADKAKSMWDNMPDYMKMSLMTTGGQGVAGLASGYFQGASAQERLELEKLINSQAQRQLQYQNKNAAYAPLVQFGQPAAPGLINAGRS